MPTFAVSRSSKCYTRDDGPPCSAAVYHCDTPESRPAPNPFDGILGVDVVRERGHWTVKIESLDELMRLVGECGRVIVGAGEIEIYDDYRE